MFWNQKKAIQAVRREPRDHHYVFAHYTVREACAHDPLRFFAIVASPDQELFIAWLWKTTEKRVGKPLIDVDPSELKVITCRVKESPAIILQMPSPVASAEAHLVAVLLTDLQKPIDTETKAAFRYFTLEHGVTLDGSTRTVLCEWDESGHRNFGDGPLPTVEAFATVLEGKI
ncbi:MAG: hypothetical protein V4772_26835 [Pseudomonadota bacterium]